MAKLFANSGDPDQTLHSAASDLGLHCLPVTLLQVSRWQCVNEAQSFSLAPHHFLSTDNSLYKDTRYHFENTLIQIYWQFHHQNGCFQTKNLIIFHISAHNIDCGYSLELPRRGSPSKYPQYMFLNRNKKNNVYPYKPQFYYISGV